MTLINVAVLFIAILHVWFLILEIFLWQKPIGLRAFKLNPLLAQQTASLAANQGLYNGFLAAGLIWSVIESDVNQAFALKVFFLSCVLIAGVFAGASVRWRIFWIQGLPAALVLGLLFF